MDYEDLLLEKKDHVTIVTLNVPEKLNAITKKMSQSLAKVANDIALDDEVRVVVLTGASRGFCSGADVSMMASRGSGSAPSRFASAQVTGYPHYNAFPQLSKPVIAAINGACVGGGLSLALSCDIRIAADNAKFGVAQVSRGLVPDYGLTYYLPLSIGVSRASEMMYTAETIGAAEAEKLGIISKVVPLDKLMSVAMELANKIAQQPPYSVELSKKIVWRSLLENLNRQMDLETWASHICANTEDHKASVQAFLNKQPTPKYQGK
jgi:enoyl-CoA hydratase/carnithine racemase